MALHEEWEGHFDPTRREYRQERKRASRTDRSKYKLSDQDKAQKPTVEPTAGLVLGRVVYIQSQIVEVETADGNRRRCTLKGALKQEKTLKKNLVIVGDAVWIEPSGDSAGVIHHIGARSSILCRQEHLHRLKQQLVAANVDQVLITVSLAEPSFRTALIDRYVIAAKKGRIAPVILINKLDLRDTYPEGWALAESCLHIYPPLGIPVVAISAQSGEGLPLLREMLRDKVSVFSGQSGTGKTQIINRLTGLSLRTGTIRAIGKGPHTTTSTRLLTIPSGGWCVDTPGIRSFGIFELGRDDLRDAFPEIFSVQCSFTTCRHVGEKGCAIQDAVDRGEVSPLRLESYRSLLASINESNRYHPASGSPSP